MKTVSRMIIAAFIMFFAVVANAQTINVKLKIDDQINTQYTAFFEVCDILGNTYTITSANPVDWLQNGGNVVSLTCVVPYLVNFPFYIVKVRVHYMSQLAPVRYDQIQPVNTADLYQQTHFLSVSF
ncbi:MAG: hypothetical protein CVU06_14445 [Bacteroidetes bacterium HGW-Bacteroidetes-22]|nr:MAG: hypothetical protein CVU06_14445 [Bacteroidetes bacterium HGW-Bacteroidetes-22]